MADFKEFTDKFVTEVANMANFIGTQAGKIVDKTKLKMSIANHEAIVENLYKQLGKHYYHLYRQGEAIDEPMIEVCKLVESNLKTIKAMKEAMESEAKE